MKPHHALFNRQRGELIFVKGGIDPDSLQVVDGIAVAWWKPVVKLPVATGGDAAVDAKTWLDGAVLVKIGFERGPIYRAQIAERVLKVDAVETASDFDGRFLWGYGN